MSLNICVIGDNIITTVLVLDEVYVEREIKVNNNNTIR